jgi:glycosyltransferase involved in cell wall biosynthesis
VKIGLVVPHIFMHREILPQVIFSPGRLAMNLAEGLQALGAEVTLLTPGLVDTAVQNVTADLSYFERELAARGDGYVDLLKKHPLTFITLARQVQSEIIADAYARAAAGEFDVVHIYTNEEDIALPFARLCARPVVFTHHDPFNFLVKYKNVFPKYAHARWISMSLAQRSEMPPETNWVGNIYHGVDQHELKPAAPTAERYVAYLGRIIEPKGVHLAIRAVRRFNAKVQPGQRVKLRLAGKHYAGAKDSYWRERILPELAEDVEYAGFLRTTAQIQSFLGGARALVVPSTFAEPFGMVMIEALACGTPGVGLDTGAIPEVISEGVTGAVVRKIHEADGRLDEAATVAALAQALQRVDDYDRSECRREFERRFTIERMAQEHLAVYEKVVHGTGASREFPPSRRG